MIGAGISWRWARPRNLDADQKSCLARSREDRPFHFGSWTRPNKMSVAFLQNLAGVLDLGQNRPLLDEVNCNVPCGPVVRREVCTLGESISNAAQNEAFER
jgi:hypothetical protein